MIHPAVTWGAEAHLMAPIMPGYRHPAPRPASVKINHRRARVENNVRFCGCWGRDTTC